jgi:hypothetical protein
LNSLKGGFAIGGLIQFASDIFDCSLSFPEQLARAGVVAAEGAALAFGIGLIATASVGLAAPIAVAVIVVGASILFDYLNNEILFPAISEHLGSNNLPIRTRPRIRRRQRQRYTYFLLTSKMGEKN